MVRNTSCIQNNIDLNHRGTSENGNKVVDSVLCVLSDALCDLCSVSAPPWSRHDKPAATHPSQVPNLLLFELDEAVEDGILELLKEALLVELDVVFKELVLQAGTLVRIVSAVRVFEGRSASCLFKERAVFRNVIDSLDHGIDIVCASKRIVAFRVQSSDGGEQLCTLFLGELSAERIDGDVECPAIGFKRENLAHDFGCGGWKGLTELMEIFEIRFVQAVTDDLDVQVVEVLRRQTIAEVGR